MTTHQRTRLIVTALLALILIASAAAQTPAPRRIVSLVPAVTEMLFAIGAGPQVVAVSSFDRYPPEAATRPKVGALIDPDFERILGLSPDLIVVYGTQGDLITRLERVRIPMFNYQHAGLRDITMTIRRLGAGVGRAAEARRLADQIDMEIEDVRTRVAGRPRPRAALLFGREAGTLRDIYASGGVGFLHDVLLAAGGDDVFADVKRESVQATTELLLARAPEVIVELHPTEGWSADRIAREREVWRGLPGLPAVRAGRVHILADDVLLVPGPRIAGVVRRLAEVLHPGTQR